MKRFDPLSSVTSPERSVAASWQFSARMKKSFLNAAILMVASFGFSISMADAQNPTQRAYGKGHAFQAEELPAGKLKSKLLSLNPQARERATKWLHEFTFAEVDAADHLRVDDTGGIFIVCPDHRGDCEGHSHGPAKAEAETDDLKPTAGTPAAPATSSAPTVESAAVAVTTPPAYNSKPGAARHIYLDFNGGTVTGTAWNNNASYGNIASWTVKVWTQDADATTFNDSEQAWMRRVWQRVAEDYAPFDVNVTTDVTYDPDTYTGNKDNVGWVLICETTDANGVALPHNGSGGVAYVGVFGNSTYSPTYQPAWVSSSNGGGRQDVVAEAASHEMGHNMGLSHDTTSTLTYYGGHDATATAPSWGPIMGTGYFQNVSQWSKGEYFDATQPQDDLAIISARVPYRADDFGDTPATASAWANSPVSQAGIVETTNDPDCFKFTTSAGAVSFSASPFRSDADTWGGNLDILLELYDSTQTLVASGNPTAETTASISANLAAGTYYLMVKPVAAGTPLVSPPSGYTVYASLGQYNVTGSFVPDNTPEIAVEQPVGTDLVDGSASINCGTAVVAASSSPLTFTVKNVGSASLNGLSITKDGTNSADFSVSSLTTTLASGTSTTFTVSFSPGATGSRTAAIHIASNDADENPFDINLTGTGIAPGTLAITPTTGLASSGSVGGPFTPSSLTYTLSNSGGTSINWTASKTQSWVTLSATGGTLAAGASTSVTVSINSGANSLLEGGYSDLISFANSTNGSGNSTRDVALSINGSTALWNQNFDSSAAGWTSTSESGTNSWSLTTSASHTPTSSFFASGPSSVSITHLTSPPISVPAAPTNLSLEFWHRYSFQSTRDCGKFYLSIDGGSWFEVTSLNSGVSFTTNGYNSTINSQTNPFDGQTAWSNNTSSAFVKTSISFTDIPKYAGKQLRLRWTIGTNNQTSSSGWYVDSVSLISANTSTPGALTVSPAVELNYSGAIGGPFTPATQSYTLQNTGSTSINWTATKTANWVTLSATSGSLAAGASTSITVTINSSANSLLLGGYIDTVTFTNATNGGGNTTRGIALTVAEASPLTVTPSGNLSASGSFGGPFSPTSQEYTLQNTGATSLDWTAAKTTNWISLSATSGTLAPGATTTVTATIHTTANSLNAGTYSDTLTFTDITNGNLNTTRTVSLSVTPKPATVVLGNLAQTYNGSARSATATTSPAGLSVSFTYNGSSTPPTNAGSYTVVGTINDNNYVGSSSGTLEIAKATATLTLGNLSQTYNGSAKSATATTSPSGLTVGFTYNGSATAPTNAGSYTVVGTINDSNYSGSSTATLVIAKAPATMTLGSLAQTYNGSARITTATTSPTGLTVDFTYNGSATPPVNAGSYSVVGTINSINYTGSSSGTLTVAKAAATVTLGTLSQIYDGSPKSVTTVTNPPTLTVGITYGGSSTAPTNAGTYSVVATVNDTNYQGSASGSLVIGKATATVALGSLSPTYDGSAKPVSVTTSPLSLSVGLTYNGSATAPTNAGTYSVVATVNDTNYQGSASSSLVIGKATATVTLGSLSPTYDGSAKPVSVTTSPLSLSVGLTYNGSATAPTNAGTYSVVATVNDTNYQGSASGSLVIGKATATVALGGLFATYDGNPKSATVTTAPADLTVAMTYNGSPLAPTAAGSYSVVAVLTETNYQGSATGSLVISNDLIVANSQAVVAPNQTISYENLLNAGTLTFNAGTTNINGNATNHGVLRLTGDAILSVAGTFTNTGVIDIINWSGTLPSTLINSGTILDRSAIKVLSTDSNATTFTLTVPSYSGHLYQLQSKADLSAAWQPEGTPVVGTGGATNPPALTFSPTRVGPRHFYRVVVTPAP